jgi:transmembrane sensor
MDLLPDNTIPWHLITAALQGNLTPEEDAAFQQWTEASARNRELFLKVKDMWENDLDDFPAYQQANETVAWNALHRKLQEAVTGENGHTTVAVGGTIKKRGFLLRVVSIAALFVVVAGIILWYMTANGGRNYTTGTGEQSVSLPDGTIIKLFAATSIEVPTAYNHETRKVILKSGKAFFEVEHKEEIPFIVDLGTASVKDLGTSFGVQKTNDSINVWVATGNVEFTNRANSQVRPLSAGMRLKFLQGSGNSHPAIFVDSSALQNQNLLRFVNTPLPDIIDNFKIVYNKQIIIIDSVLIQKKFTGNFEGQSFEGAIDVLCKALNIRFVRQNDTCYLKRE